MPTLGKPFACPPMIVTSPGFGFGLLSGIYCLTTNFGTSSSPFAVAVAYSLVC